MNEIPTTDELLLELIKKYIPEFSLSDHDVQNIINRIKPIRLKKGDVFCEKGKVCQAIGILIHGTMLAITESEKSDRNVSRIFYVSESIFVTSFKSFSKRIPSQETIYSTEDCILMTISHEDLTWLYREVPSMNHIGRVIAEQSYIKALDKIRIFQSQKSKEKIHEFFDENPNLWGRVRITDIASYLEVNRNLVTKHYNSWKKK